MFNFGLSQTLSSLCFVAISVSILLSLSLPAVAEVNSPTLTVLDMEEMSQIAGGSMCKIIKVLSNSPQGRCAAKGDLCGHYTNCGTNPYIEFNDQHYCQNSNVGFDECSCTTTGAGWLVYNCQNCRKGEKGFAGGCAGKGLPISGGGRRIRCTVDNSCP